MRILIEYIQGVQSAVYHISHMAAGFILSSYALLYFLSQLFFVSSVLLVRFLTHKLRHKDFY